MQPHISYLVCATPRSGSTLLCEDLTNTGLAGYPKEYFEALKETGLPRSPRDYFKKTSNPELLDLIGNYSRGDDASPVLTGFASYADYLTHVLEEGTTPNGVFGAKLMWGYLEDFLLYLRDIPAYKDLPVPQLFATIFPNLHYIHISRRDKVRQAISLWRAIQSWSWRQERGSDGTPPRPARELVFNYAAIDHLVQRTLAHEEAWKNYFTENAIQPCYVVYEELVETYEKTTLHILQYLNIPLPASLSFGERLMRQQADTLSEEWYERYHEMKEQ
ncbi:MAG TPA: Stf0 family sulfotransferase [Ktedonobacteraceae bacterium]